MSTTTRVAPEVTKMFIRKGVAGQFSVQATVAYPGEDPRTVEFVGSAYGGPVLMVTEHGQTWVTDPGRFGTFGWVTDPGRFGTFGKAWVRKFFA